MGQNPTSEANSRSAGREVPCPCHCVRFYTRTVYTVSSLPQPCCM